MAAVIEVKDLVKDYKLGEVPVHVLKNISLEIARGDFVAIMGPSGSGKSTLMNILGCLDKPTSGTYTLDGISVGQLSRDELAEIRNKKIGFVFQQFNLLARTSALENVELPLMYTNVGAAERHDRAAKALLRGTGRPRGASAESAFRRPTAARGDCPCAGERSPDYLGGRADRGGGLEDQH
jgi:putative ABC transport system ATP-binding protein